MHWKTIVCPFRSRRSSDAKNSSMKKLSSPKKSKKRRGIWRDDGVSTSAASTFSSMDEEPIQLGEDAPPTAPWRIENIRSNGPPSESEWWTKTPEAKSISIDPDIEISSEEEESSSTTDESPEFINCGLESWQKVQQAWRVQTVTEEPPRPPPVNRVAVADGLSHISRHYELPGPMRLTDVIGIYQEIWE